MRPIRTLSQLGRKRGSRRARARILIVSEGAKTEGLYLSLLIREHGASNVSVDLYGRECGTDPLSVVEFARQKFTSDGDYDFCYCLIDRDSHPVERFTRALEICEDTDKKSGKRSFSAIVSYPCIEVWFLFHFVYRRAPFTSTGNKSPAGAVISELKKFLPRYSKSDRDEIEKLLPRTPEAAKNAKMAASDADDTGEPNPSTSMHLVVLKILGEVKA
ncbi:RloB family protein [Sphingomonadaceae bacterium KCTC 52780]|uniref:RloB family protein n=1 Tax=Sphingosinicella terrae TaxID=2172047 RepID=UPI000E0DCEAB